MKIKTALFFLSCLLIAGGTVWFVVSRPVPAADGEGGDAAGTAAIASSSPRSSKVKTVKTEKTATAAVDKKAAKKAKRKETKITALTLEELLNNKEHPLSAEEMSIAKELAEVLESITSLEAAGTNAGQAKERAWNVAAMAAKSRNPELRKQAIEAYLSLDESHGGSDSAGYSALAETTMLMADENEEVSEEAISAVEQMLLNQENAQLRFEAAVAYMSTFSANGDALEMLSGIGAGAALDIIEPTSDSAAAELAAAQRRQMVVDSVTELIENGSTLCSEQALELYSDITGEDWVDANEAALWAKNPDDYESPELREISAASDISGADAADDYAAPADGANAQTLEGGIQQ